MTKLEKLYNSIQTLKELGAKLPEELIAQTDKLEEDIIKNEILPVVTEKIEPIISQIQRELVLVVDYIPNEPLAIKLSRKRNFSELSEAKELTPDAPVQHNTGKITRKTAQGKKPKTNLRVTFPDGKVVENHFAYETLLEVIRRAGAEKVRELGHIQCGVPLVSTTIDDYYGNAQHEIAKGLYVITHSSTQAKKQQIEEISKALKLNLKVEILD